MEYQIEQQPGMEQEEGEGPIDDDEDAGIRLTVPGNTPDYLLG